MTENLRCASVHGGTLFGPTGVSLNPAAPDAMFLPIRSARSVVARVEAAYSRGLDSTACGFSNTRAFTVRACFDPSHADDPINPSLGFASGWSVMPRGDVESHEHVGSYGAYVAYATIQTSRVRAAGVSPISVRSGAQGCGVRRVALQIVARLSTDKKLD